MRDAKVGRSGPKQLVGMVDEALTLRAAQELEALRDLGLQRRTETLPGREPVLLAGLLEVLQGCDPKLLVDAQDLLGREAGDLQHLEHARGHLGPHGFQPWRSSVLVQGTDDLGERGPNTRDLAQPILRDYVLKRDGEREKALGRSGVGTSFVGVLARQQEPLVELQ